MTYRRAVQVWYGSRRWKAKRLYHLRANPICVFCERDGRVTVATVADHIVPHKGNEALFWNGRLQGLCKHCHDSEKARIEAGKAVTTTGVDGWPVTAGGGVDR